MHYNFYLNEKINIIDNELKKYVHKHDNLQHTIYEAMEYSLFAGGKRIRPVIMMSVCEMCGGDLERVLPFACSMEMIHTYSLIHDDLPAMDNDDLRRGQPTNHKKFGEATAILAGDALLNKAFEITSNYDIEGVDAKTVLKAIHLLSSSSGTEGMIGGQVVDMESENKKIYIDHLRYLHLLKTGAIIRSSATIGALLAGGSEKDLALVDDFAFNLGIAFQIQDDILDVVGNEQDLGKPIGSDKQSNKNTYVSLCGLEKSKKLVAEYSDKAIKALEPFGEKAGFLIELTNYLINRIS